MIVKNSNLRNKSIFIMQKQSAMNCIYEGEWARELKLSGQHSQASYIRGRWMSTFSLDQRHRPMDASTSSSSPSSQLSVHQPSLVAFSMELYSV